MSDFVEHLDMDGGLSVTTWKDDAPVLGFQIQAFNWRLRRAREAKGWSRKDLSIASGVDQSTVGRAEKLGHASENARWNMALALGVPEDVLFPGELDALPKGGPPLIELSLTREDVSSLAEPDAHQDMIQGAEQEAFREQLTGILETLTPREQRVIQMRFGLVDGAPRLLHEIGDQFGVDRERIRQIEAKALQKLRRSSRIRALLPYVTELPPRLSRPRPDKCQRPEDGQTCADRSELPGWMIVAPAGDLRRPMFWCGVCWSTFLRARSKSVQHA